MQFNREFECIQNKHECAIGTVGQPASETARKRASTLFYKSYAQDTESPNKALRIPEQHTNQIQHKSKLQICIRKRRAPDSLDAQTTDAVAAAAEAGLCQLCAAAAAAYTEL